MEKNEDVQAMRKLFVEALRGDSHQHFAVVWEANETGFAGDGDQTPEIVRLLQLHQSLFIRLLKDNVVALHWNDWGDRAQVTIVPVDVDAETKFEFFELKLPPRQPVAAVH
jgi:hypothetical protein